MNMAKAFSLTVACTMVAALFTSHACAQVLQPRQAVQQQQTQTQTQTASILNNVTPNADARINAAFQTASHALAAFRQNDFEAYVDHTHATLIEAEGGRDRMVELSTQAKTALAEQTDGFDTQVRQPTKLIAGTTSLYAIIPQTVFITLKNGQEMNRTSYLLGVSGDNGRNWKLVDGATGAVRIRELFSDFPQNERLPDEPRR